MKLKSKKWLAMSMAAILIICTQTTSVFAAVDGPLVMTHQNGLYLYQSQSTSSSVLMTMNLTEALARLGSGSSGYWASYRGWKSTTSSLVDGWSASTSIGSPARVTAKYALTIYSNDGGTVANVNDVPVNAWMNVAEYGQYVHSNLVYLRAYNYYNPNTGLLVTASQLGVSPYFFVHTNFRTTAPSSYYLTLMPLA
jgi:hypothetical protein